MDDNRPHLKYLLVSPERFTMRESINPLSNNSRAPIDHTLAAIQFRTLINVLDDTDADYSIISPNIIDSTGTTPDILYTANWGISLPIPTCPFVLSRMKTTYRKPEPAKVAAYMIAALHTNLYTIPRGIIFEGTGLACWSHEYRHLWLAYGVRTTYKDAVWLRNQITDIYRAHKTTPPTIHLLHIQNPWYDLDLAFLAFPNGRLLYRPEAFSARSVREIIDVFGETAAIPFPFDNDPFALNAKIIPRRRGGHFILCGTIRTHSKEYVNAVSGLEVISCPLTYAEKGGGSVRCCMLDYFANIGTK